MLHPRSPHGSTSTAPSVTPNMEQLPGGVVCASLPPDVEQLEPPHFTHQDTTVTSTKFSDTLAQTPHGLSEEMTIKEEWMELPTYNVSHHLQSSNLNTAYYASDLSAISSDSSGYEAFGSPYMDNHNLVYAMRCPRTDTSYLYNTMNHTGLPMNSKRCEAYPPAVYHIDPQPHFDAVATSDHGNNDHLMEMYDEYSMYTPQSHVDDHNEYRSPYSDMSRPSPPPDAFPRGSRTINHGREGVFDKDQPYAQLIYKALKEADGHTMILRDIYDWFKKNTDKASTSQSKGWQNSIRHNLSMNGAFEKVDQPGEDPRKGYMWRLTKEALHEGVKSTTRYRKQPKFAYRSRHTSAARSTRRTANMKRSKLSDQQYQLEPHMSSAMPDTYDAFSDSDMSYASPPYYSPQLGSGYPIKSEHNEQPASNSLELFPMVKPEFEMQAIPKHMSIAGSPYMMEHQAGEPLFTNSPTPPADEPRTPLGSDLKFKVEDVDMAHPCFYDAY